MHPNILRWRPIAPYFMVLWWSCSRFLPEKNIPKLHRKRRGNPSFRRLSIRGLCLAVLCDDGSDGPLSFQFQLLGHTVEAQEYERVPPLIAVSSRFHLLHPPGPIDNKQRSPQ